ncbi:unnamed protein product [Pleuronectes platessa]|uniref:Uncharacterized protein n=1 Tax=Pleuronectes platessa TaxID=8262 RepID=A0A9N7YPI1_PLEPL|nr:unnamed protein product [Pleuronectes platessa]
MEEDRDVLAVVWANSSKVQIGIRDKDWTRAYHTWGDICLLFGASMPTLNECKEQQISNAAVTPCTSTQCSPGDSFLPKDTSTCGLEEPRINHPPPLEPQIPHFVILWGGHSGFSILPKDTSACRWVRLGIEPPAFRLEDDHSTPQPQP